jgi:signal transduction histidine kinase
MPEELELSTSALGWYLDAQRGTILAAYRAFLRAGHNPLASSQEAVEQVVAHADETINEVVAVLRSGEQLPVGRPLPLPAKIGAIRAEAGMHMADSLWAASGLFRIITEAIAAYPDGELQSQTFAMLVLNQIIADRFSQTLTSYCGWLLTRVHQVQADERLRLARDLHDRVSAGINASYRQLELLDLARAGDPAANFRRVERARDALVQSMHEIRNLIAGLRGAAQGEGLETSLRSYLESLGGDAAVDIVVDGDETWVAADVMDQVFLIIREALRNAYQHGKPGAILVRVAIAPHELWARVDDDGAGFDPAACGASGGSGVRSMEERAGLLGGVIRVSSSPGKGANIEIRIPLDPSARMI